MEKKRINISLTAIAISSAFFLFLIRPSVLGLGWQIYQQPFAHLGEMISASFNDVLFIAAFMLLFLFLNLITKRWVFLNKSLPFCPVLQYLAVYP